MLNAPILFLIFNRPDHTQKVFWQLRAAKPKRLFIAADGPRPGVSSDKEACRLSRSFVLENIDWDCDVKTLLRDSNMGCGASIAQAISWFFEHVEEGIILEDDCLPDPFFFEFCTALLARYRNDGRIMHISGNNFQYGVKRGAASYYFSAYSHIWGWATWRRSWSRFVYDISGLDHSKLLAGFKLYGFNKREREFWLAIFMKMSETKPNDIWDYQWAHTIWRNSGLCILPNENLVVNIGFGSDATHTKMPPHQYEQMKLGKMDRLIHPNRICVDTEADHYSFRNHLHVRESAYRRLKNKLILNPSIRFLYERVKKLSFGNKLH